MIKILHCADIHLDSPFASENAIKAEVRRNELRGTFTSMMMYAKKNGADIVLIAGDLYDNEFVTKETVSLIIREFENNPDCRFIISPGNHDIYTVNSVYSRTNFPENVYIFNTDVLSYFSFEDINTDVYGYAFVRREMQKNPFAGLLPQNHNAINLLCAHGDMLLGEKDCCPIKVNEIETSGFDYVALGHIHNSTGIEKTGNVYYAYSGCPEGRDYGETGYKGALWLEIDKGNVKAKELRFSKRRYESEKLNITGASSMTDVISNLRKLVTDQKYADDTALRVQFEGDVAPSLIISPSMLREQFKTLFELEVIDKTMPIYDYSYLENDPTIRGAFFEKIMPIFRNGSPEEQNIAARALRYGLSAISGNDIADFEL